MSLLQQTGPTVKVRILIPTSLALENTIKNEFHKSRRIQIRYFLHTSPQTIQHNTEIVSYIKLDLLWLGNNNNGKHQEQRNDYGK